MVSPCVIVPYMMWWSNYDLSDLILACVVSLVAFGISAWLAKKIIDKIHS